MNWFTKLFKSTNPEPTIVHDKVKTTVSKDKGKDSFSKGYVPPKPQVSTHDDSNAYLNSISSYSSYSGSSCGTSSYGSSTSSYGSSSSCSSSSDSSSSDSGSSDSGGGGCD